MFLNDVVGNDVTIDIDIYVTDWIQHGGYQATLRRLEDLAKFIKELKAFYRESSSKNIHIRIQTKEKLTLLDSLLIRAYFGDDETRLMADMCRYFRSGKIDDLGKFASGDLLEIGRCFDEKWKNGKKGKAGHWIPIQESIYPGMMNP